MPNLKLFLIIPRFFILLLVMGCQPLSTSTTPIPTETIVAQETPEPLSTSQGYPGPQNFDNPLAYPAPTATWTSQTAFQSFPVAEEAAKKWNPDAQLYEIPATIHMEMNFGRPITGEGWYFMFKVADSPLEYYVYVSDGKVSGTTEAQPIIFDKPPYEFQPLPSLSAMWDSDQVLKSYEQHDGKKYLSENPKVVFNYQLSFLKGDPFPIWSIFDSTKPKDDTALFAVNALTGEIQPVK